MSMWVMRVERVEGEYTEPEIVDLDDGSGCLFRLHGLDITEQGAAWLAQLLTEQAQAWAPRPKNCRGPVVPTHFVLDDLPEPFAMCVDDKPDSITYSVDTPLMSARGADSLGRRITERSPYWQRVPKGYHEGREAG